MDLRLSLRPYYLFKPPTCEKHGQDIAGDGKWHTYTFRRCDYILKRFSIQSVDFYFDQGAGINLDTQIQIDDVRIGWYAPEVRDSTASNINGTDLKLTWSTTMPDHTARHKICRSTKSGSCP